MEDALRLYLARASVLVAHLFEVTLLCPGFKENPKDCAAVKVTI
jgi:hypothetical protein